MRAARIAFALALVACAGSSGSIRTPPSDEDDPAARASRVAPALDGYHAAYVLLWQGARIGEARERFYATEEADGGYRFERQERIVVRRGRVTAAAMTRIEVDADETLRARRLIVDHVAGTARTHAEATRMVDDGWIVEYGGAPRRTVDGNAVPSTLVPLIVAAQGISPGRAWEGNVLLEGGGLALAHLAVDISDDRSTASATIDSAAGIVQANAELDARGYVASAGSPDGVASRRASENELGRSFQPPEIVDTSAIAVDGRPSAGSSAVRLVLAGVRAKPPRLPEVEDQTVAMGVGGTWNVQIEQSDLPDDIREVRERTSFVAHTLVDDLATFTLAPEEAMAAGRGDCTAHAMVLAKLLEERGYQARLVTGFVIDDGALRRHRWVVVRVGNHWLPVDPMFDEVPAAPTHLALAVSGASPDELAFIDDVAFAGFESATARWR